MVERSNPSALANPPGYSHVVKDGTTVYVAGQVARNSNGITVGVGDFSAQAEQVFKNVQAALESVGTDMSHIMKLNVFMTHREDLPTYRVLRPKFVPCLITNSLKPNDTFSRLSRLIKKISRNNRLVILSALATALHLDYNCQYRSTEA